MTWTIVVAYCIVDDLLKVLGHQDDPQSKTPASVVLSIWILAALEHGCFAKQTRLSGKHNKALERCEELGLFSFIPSRSRFNRRLHAVSYLIPLLLPLFKTLWEQLQEVQEYVLDTLPLPVCENIRAPRCRLAKDISYRGYIPSKKVYFHGLKLHLLAASNRFLCEVQFTPGSTADLDGLYLMSLDLAQGSELYLDRGYTDYLAEDDLKQAQAIHVRAIRKHNSKRYYQPSQFIAILGRKIIESVGSALTELFPKRIHATTLQGFVLKVWGFVFAHNCKLLARIL